MISQNTGIAQPLKAWKIKAVRLAQGLTVWALTTAARIRSRGVDT